MSITLLLFGATADAVGSRELEFDVDERSSVASLLKDLKTKNPRLAVHKLLVAVNEEYAELDAILKDSDEVAIFTVVSGG